MLFTLQFLQKQFPNFKGRPTVSVGIKEIMTDSRKKQAQSLFVPIVGERFDAHRFLETAIENGAVAALWEESKAIPTNVPESFVFYLVKDTTVALQELAKAYLQKINPIVIGVTGSNGKTTTKDLLTAVLSEKYRTSATIGNFNNHIGLPLTILQMEKTTEVLVLEMGMSEFGEIELLTKLAQPTYAVITNIGESHIEYLESREGIAKAKLEICDGLQKNGYLIIDGDEVLLEHMHKKENTITCGFSEHNYYQVISPKLVEDGTNFELNKVQYHLPLFGKHHAQNASFVIAIAEKLGLTKEEIQTGFDALNLSEMRFERITGKNKSLLINDAYNASPTSMRASIEVLKEMNGFEKKIVVLGDVLELGPESEELHRGVAKAIDYNINTLYTIGSAAAFIVDQVNQANLDVNAKHFATKKEIIRQLSSELDEQTVVLFKASRGMALEEIVQALV